MKTLLFTIASGDKAQQHYDVAGENLQAYATKHGMDFCCITDVEAYREPHYAKTHALEAFKQGYECVVYFDIDGVLDTNAPDIREGLEPSGIYIYNELDLVESYRKNYAIRNSFVDYCNKQGVEWDGEKYYNSGAFVLFPDAACILDINDMEPGQWCHEQHCINVKIIQNRGLVHDLPERWNWHRLQFEERRNGALNGECWFAHVAGYESRGKDNGISLMQQIKSNMRHRHEKRVIITAITDEMQGVAQLTLPKLRAYAERCKAELIILEGMPEKYQHPKYRMFEASEIEADRYLIVDSDIIIKDNAPDIFIEHPEGNWMIDESIQREAGAFSHHQSEMIKRARRESLYVPDSFAQWWNPGVALLDRDAVKAIYKMPPWDVQAKENLWQVEGGKQIVKNMPWINYRIVASGVNMNALELRWNTIVNRLNNLNAAYFLHCTASEADENRKAAKIDCIKNVCARLNEPLYIRGYHVHFVIGNDQHDWILGRMMHAIQTDAPPHVRFTSGTSPVDEVGVVNYYLPYRIWKGKQTKAKDVVFCTHPEIEDLYYESAQQADHVVVMCPKYKDDLNQRGIENVTYILPGVDDCYINRRLRVFNPTRMNANPGYRARKGVELWERLKKMPDLHCVCTDGKMTPQQVYTEYLKADVVVSTATMEGGPMSALEAHSLGKPFYIRKGVGLETVAKRWNNVYTYELEDELIAALVYRAVGKQSDIKSLPWTEWRDKHIELFDSIAEFINMTLTIGAKPRRTPPPPTVEKIYIFSQMPNRLLKQVIGYIEDKGYAPVVTPKREQADIDFSEKIDTSYLEMVKVVKGILERKAAKETAK